MGFLDKWRRPKGAAGSRPEIPEPLQRWLKELFEQFEPARLRIQPGETLGGAIARLVDGEEERVREGNEPPEVRQAKLQALAELRRQFTLTEPSDASARRGESSNARRASQEPNMSQENESRPAEAAYEMVMGGMQELKEVPLSHFMGLVQLWSQIVETFGQAAKVAETFRQEYHRVYVTLTPAGKEYELVAGFHGSRDMITVFRQKLQEMGLESS